jgi:hypothetical protein
LFRFRKNQLTPPEAENIKPKATGGVHKVIDEQFSESTRSKKAKLTINKEQRAESK